MPTLIDRLHSKTVIANNNVESDQGEACRVVVCERTRQEKMH